MGCVTAPWGLSVPAGAFGVGGGPCFPESCCAKLLRAAVAGASPFGGRVSVLTPQPPLPKPRRSLATGRWSWALLGDCDSFCTFHVV